MNKQFLFNHKSASYHYSILTTEESQSKCEHRSQWPLMAIIQNWWTEAFKWSRKQNAVWDVPLNHRSPSITASCKSLHQMFLLSWSPAFAGFVIRGLTLGPATMACPFRWPTLIAVVVRHFFSTYSNCIQVAGAKLHDLWLTKPNKA